MDDMEAPPMRGKLKGGPKKMPDVKPTKMAKISAPKAPAGGKGGKMKTGGKISAPKAHNYVKPRLSAPKAKPEFKLKQGAAKKKVK